MLVSELGRVTVLRAVHLSKVLSSSIVTEFGMVIEARLLQS